MCSSQQPLAGADSMPIDTLDRGCQEPGCWATWTAGETHEHERPYRCLVEEWDGNRVWLTVTAIGPKGAAVTAKQTAIDKGYDPITVVKVEQAA